MRATALFMPTVKEDPADAEAVSHKLMVRGGFVRQFASGIYIMLPLGWRVMQRICDIIREEMDAIGALELSMPTMHPADVWQATGRYDAIGPEMFRLQDRGGRDMVLAMTHEEVFAWLASRELRSYRDLPQIWYQLQLKFRDEPRPKGGVLRVREFLMKDSYSFDVDEDGLEKSYEKHIGAYDRIFERCGIEFYRVESDSGFMGGAQAHEYMAPSPAGEDRIALCEACGYSANVELARSVARAPDATARLKRRGPPAGAPREVATPDQRTIEEVSTFLGVRPTSIIKALVYMAGDQPVMALVRGDHSLHENKLARYLKSEVRAAHPEEVKAATGAEVGFVGPVGLPAGKALRVVADETLRPGDDGLATAGGPREYAAGANKAAHSPAGRSGRAGLPARVRRPARSRGRRRLPRVRPAAGGEAGDRGGQHLQAGNQVLASSGRDRPRRVGPGAPHRHGLLRHRAGPHRRGGGRATQRRARHRVAQGHRSLRRPPGAGAGEGLRAGRGGSDPPRRSHRRGLGGAVGRSRPAPRFQVRRRRTHRLPGEGDSGQEGRRGSGRGRAAAGRRSGARWLWPSAPPTCAACGRPPADARVSAAVL